MQVCCSVGDYYVSSVSAECGVCLYSFVYVHVDIVHVEYWQML